MTRLAIALLALVAASATAQEGKLVQGNVYNCVKDGVRHYKSQPLEGAECTIIKYSYLQRELLPGWVPMAQGDGMISYYRAKDVTRSGQQVTFWALDDNEEAQYEPGSGFGAYKSSISRMVVGCAEKTYRPVQTTYYADRFGKGKVVGNWVQRGAPDPRYATPNSMGEVMVDAICAASRPKPKGT